MTDNTPSADVAAMAPATVGASPPAVASGDHDLALQPVLPGQLTAMRIGAALFFVPLALGLTLVDVLALRGNDLAWGGLTVGSWLLAAWAVLVHPARAWARLGYAEGQDSLRVARGYMFRTDTIVPFVRVQHIDVGQGPVERMAGVAHLVLHTSGTHNSTVTLPGLDPAEAQRLRDTIRRHIQTDFA